MAKSRFDAFALVGGRRRNKFVFLLLKDKKFRAFLRNKMKEFNFSRAYTAHVCSMDAPEIGFDTFRNTCTFSALEWAESYNFDLLRILEAVKHICSFGLRKKTFIPFNGATFLFSSSQEEKELLTNFSSCKDGVKYIEYNKGSHRLIRSASAVYEDAICNICGDVIPEVVANRAGELFASLWKSRGLSQVDNKYRLVIDNDFGKIYSSDYCRGNFGSCMQNTGFESMYASFEGARACYLEDESGDVVARAILWEQVYDLQSGEYYIYLDRQYAMDGRQDLKELLIMKIKEKFKGENLLYMPSDASCTDSLHIFTTQGVPFTNASYLRVKSSLTADDVVCYMDTFKYLDVSNGSCYTQTPSGCNDANIALLETTNGEIELSREWSEYEDEYIPRSEAIYSEWYDSYIREYHACWSSYLDSYICKDDDALVEIRGDYYPKEGDIVIQLDDLSYHLSVDDDVCYTEDTGIWMLRENAFYCALNDAWYEHTDTMPEEPEKEPSARIVVKDNDGNIKEIEYPYDLLKKSEHFLEVVRLYDIKGLDWKDCNNVLRLYTEDAMRGTVCEGVWKENLKRHVDLCVAYIEYNKKREEAICKN